MPGTWREAEGLGQHCRDTLSFRPERRACRRDARFDGLHRIYYQIFAPSAPSNLNADRAQAVFSLRDVRREIAGGQAKKVHDERPVRTSQGVPRAFRAFGIASG